MRYVLLLLVGFSIYASSIEDTKTKGILYDKKSGLFWQDQKANSDTNKKLTYKKAIEYCENLKLGGYRWRLPTIDELKSIVDYKREDKAIKKGFKYVSVGKYDWYWSSSQDVSDKKYAWVVDFYYGDDGFGHKSDSGFVRCVRQ
jgi:predicted ribonuclease toxin of YeeF-YezG toxin-antitoxin module